MYWLKYTQVKLVLLNFSQKYLHYRFLYVRNDKDFFVLKFYRRVEKDFAYKSYRKKTFFHEIINNFSYRHLVTGVVQKINIMWGL